MLVKSKGNTVEIAPGVRFIENNHSRGGVYSLETITEVEIIDNYEINGKSYKQYRWQARNIETGEIAFYCITDGYWAYGPTLFQTLEDATAFWNYWNRPRK